MKRILTLFNALSLVPLALMLNYSVHAQDSTFSDYDYSIDQVMVTANKLSMKLKDVSTKVEVLDNKKIESVNGTRLPELLKTTPSVFIKAYGPTPTLQTISINGLGAEHTLVLIDGVRLNSHQNSTIDLSLIPKEEIERIEIINNGISSIYGSDAMGGVVNIISKSRRNLQQETNSSINASFTGGSFNTMKYSLGYYQQFKNFNAKVYYNSEKSDGNFKHYYDNGAVKEIKERENTAYSLYDIGINSQYIIDENNLIKFISTYSDQNKDVPGIETGTPPPLTKQYDKNWNNIFIVENILSTSLKLKTNLNYQNNYMNYATEPYLNSFYKNIVYTAASELSFKNEGYGVTTGINITHASINSNEVESGVKRNQPAVFIASFFNLTEKIKLFPSVRYDYISDIEEGAFTYRLGINYQPFTKINLSLKGNVGKNFRSPSFNDLYWKNSGNKDLQPENSFNGEVGILYSFRYYADFNFDFNYTFINASNKIIWTPQSNGFWSPHNVAESVSNNFAINLEAVKAINKVFSFNIGGGIQFINSKKTSASFLGDPSKDKYFPYIPLQSSRFNFGISYSFIELNLFYSRTGERFSDFANNNDMPSFSLLDANVTFKVNLFDVTSKIRLAVNNLFNEDYQVISGYPMPLRNFQLTLAINY